MFTVQLLFMLWAVSTFPKLGTTFELEDTIHTLREENSYLQERLESLTLALHELRKLLWNHSKESEGDHDSDLPHMWNGWSELGKRTDAYQLLEQAFCGKDLPGEASPCLRPHNLLLLSVLCLGSLLL